jgi:DNA (cytosine-5)-methyltransferase 1
VTASAAELSTLRRQLGWTQEEAAAFAGVDRRTLQRWERGDTSPKKLVMDSFRRKLADEVKANGHGGTPVFTFVDLFAGIGGMRRGFEAVDGTCVFTSEYDKFALRTYCRNYDNSSKGHKLVEDITDVQHPSEIPQHDVLLAGFPCQPFSIAGVSKKNALGRPHGFECETQGTLFFEIEKILNYHKPQAFLLENVKNLQGHDHGRTYETIMRTLEDTLGYYVFPQVIDAKGFVPQHRERIFLVGFREKTLFSWSDVDVPPGGVKLSAILHPEDGSETPEPPYTDANGAVCDKYTLSDKLWQYLQDYADKHRRKGNGFGFGLVGPDDIARTLSARYYKDGSEILIRQDGKNPRRLTPRECARLMGFDERVSSEKERFKIPVSDTQAYRQFGNAVVVPVVTTIARAMRPHLRTTPQLSLEPHLLRSA